MRMSSYFLEGLGMGLAVGALVGGIMPQRKSPATKAVRAVTNAVDNLLGN